RCVTFHTEDGLVKSERPMSFRPGGRPSCNVPKRGGEMSTVASKLNITKVGRVVVTVADTDRALGFYSGTLGFERVVGEPMGPDMRWVEVAVSGAETTIAIAPPPQEQEAGGSQTGIILDTSDVDAAHAALKEAGVDV